ncbi:MAG: hypothetical protein KGO96_02395 [Elusimicrobia bacterium]|nr:hypothetical protein [Elusimicrobiota bacterium]MDE2237359.1 hypothetical protein [Elusimicrobiota bacterium]MDE2424744.1 hypothetical protein [Elusimicrobiota bacterium]
MSWKGLSLTLVMALCAPPGARAAANASFDGSLGGGFALPALRLTPAAAPAKTTPPVDVQRRGRCGVARWSVKTLSDADAGAVNLAPVDATVSYLSNNPASTPWNADAGSPADRRIMSGPYAETQVYRVHATLTAYKLESDRDIHMVLRDPRTGETLIAESVDPACPGADSSAQARVFANVRRQMASMLFQGQSPQPGQLNQVSLPVTLTGVRFFDPPHGQDGDANNGGELHPVLCVSTGSDCG